MASRKGIIMTAGILGAITAASFLVWIIPETNNASFTVSDFKVHLDGVKNVHAAINADLDDGLQDLMDGAVSPKEYIRMAETSTEQINSQIISMIESSPAEEWQESYLSYIESLKLSNSYIRETIVIANMIDNGADSDEIKEALESADRFRAESGSMAADSDTSRP